jgi:hypothetical protein
MVPLMITAGGAGLAIALWGARLINVARSPDVANAGLAFLAVGAFVLCIDGLAYWLR